MEKAAGQKLFNYFFITVSVAVFVIVGVRCCSVPFSHDEIATFYYYIQTGNFLPYHPHNDANNHVLNSCLGWICFHLFGDSPLSLRLPNLLALFVLIFATYKISGRLTHTYSKLILVAGFLLSFHWLSFYSLCRGYGISMSFLILGIFYLMEYFNSGKLKNLFFFYFFLQIAISAHLVLVIIAVGLTLPVIVFQLLNKKFFNKWNLGLVLIHFLLIVYWVKFSFFLQGNGMLRDDGAKDYWNTTFVSLFQMLSGSANRWIPIFILFSFLFLIGAVVVANYKKIKANIQNVFAPSVFFLFMLIGTIVLFYAMHIFFNVDYPEDRYGLFFYVFFVIALVFTADQYTGIPVKIITGIIILGTLIHFMLNVNFRKHSVYCYGTIPERFYKRLLEEQRVSPERITIGGQPMTELIYDFWNYHYKGALNVVNVSQDEIDMNNDFAIAWKRQENYYKPYYDEIDIDKDWGITLLKRKEKIKRNFLTSIDSLEPIKGQDEFYNLYSMKDTCFKSTNPLLVEVDIGSIKAEKPPNLWLVLQVDSAEGKGVSYSRIPLNWLRYDWSKMDSQKLDLVSTKLPLKVHKLVCYIWNLDKMKIQIKINSVRVYQLEGYGVSVSTPTHAKVRH